MPREEKYLIEQFMKDIETGLEIDITFKGKKYTLSRNEKYIFTDVREQNYGLYNSYKELLESVRIEGYSIVEIIEQELYENWYVY